MTNFLLLIEGEACSGVWNMAVDEALLETARETGLIAVRFYRWNSPTLSLGYFQKDWPETLPDELQTLHRVRRLSGGGAILHHHEWTYSCALPAGHPISAEPVRLYEVAHQAIIELLGEHNIAARMRGTRLEDDAPEPFLCFGRHDPRDIVLKGHKIVGSAQRRRKGAVLQHGSFLLKRSPFAPLYPGLGDLAGEEIPIAEGLPTLARRIAKDVGMPEDWPLQTELPTPIANLAKTLERTEPTF